jgi:sulfite reductase (ferredoxin)
MIGMADVKETRAQRSERLKVEKNPFEALEEIRAFARDGRASVLPEWAAFYFKWWGIYTQGDGAGALGGKGGEGVASEYFMMRIGIPNGLLTALQARTVGELARKYAGNLADITVRQAIQLHWLTVESLPYIIDALSAVGLSPKGACGDVVRNVTGCPLAGVDAREIVDASQAALAVAKALSGNNEFYNLPRKFKVSVAGCADWCSYPEINDVGVVAVQRGDEIGYTLYVGGGLSADPHIGVRLDAFVPAEKLVQAVTAIAELFRSQQGLRENRDRARLKHLFLREGWTAEKFLAEFEARLGYKLDPGVPVTPPSDGLRDHAGIHAQKQAGLSYVGASVLRGRLSGDQLVAAAGLAERFGGELRTTVMQNLIFVNIPSERAIELAKELQEIGLRVEGSAFWRGTIACTGTEFCKLAITETKGFARWVVDEMEARLPAFDQPLRLNITGCPNSCGQHWVADIGLEGKKIKADGKLVDAYLFTVGGALGEHASLTRSLAYRCLATEVPDAVERLLRGYLEQRQGEENLRAFFARTSDDALKGLLAGNTATLAV